MGGIHRKEREEKYMIPGLYLKAEWRNTTPVDWKKKEIGIGFNLDNGETMRIRIDLDSSKHLCETIEDYVSKERKQIRE